MSSPASVPSPAPETSAPATPENPSERPPLRGSPDAGSAIASPAPGGPRSDVPADVPAGVPGARQLRLGLGLLVLALLLLLPGLERAGLWDPHEVRLIEGASEPMGLAQLIKPEHAFKPRLPLLPVALGTKLFGVNELGARLPMAVVGLLCLLALGGLGRALGRRRSALLGGLVMLTTPLFFLSARQVSLTLVPVLAQLVAVTGLVLLGWPRPGRAAIDAALGAVCAATGLAASLLCGGAVLGVAAPVLGVGLALTLAGGPVLSQLVLGALGGGALCAGVRVLLAISAASPAVRLWLAGAALGLGVLGLVASLGVAGRRRGLLPGTALLVFGAGLLKAPAALQLGYSPLWAGLPHWPPNRETQIDALVRPLGFVLFPWSALVPLAVAALFRPARAVLAAGETAPADGAIVDRAEAAARADAAEGGRPGFARLVPLCWLSATFVLGTAHSALVGDAAFPALGALALLLGDYLAQLLTPAASDAAADDKADKADAEPGAALAGLCAALFAVLLGHDLFFSPEQYASAHLTETLKWPAPLTWAGQVMTAAGIVFGTLFGLGIAVPPSRLRRRLWTVAAAAAIVVSLATVHGLVPAISRHVSYRGIYTKYNRLGGGALALYAVPQSGSKIYGQAALTLNSVPDLLDFLSKQHEGGKRAFAIVGASELAGIDLQAQNRHQPYYVVDDSNVQFLLLTSSLLPGETDLNPLRRLISEQPPKPQHVVNATFDGRIELIGYDLPAEITRGDEFTVRLYFRVLQPLTSSFKIFVHFDGAGARWNADHLPLDGKFPTNFWAAGRYITDEHRVTTSRLGQAAGYYQLFTGLWPGGDGARLRVTAGDHEPDNRVRLGAIKVK